jgi:hypothetical protein
MPEGWEGSWRGGTWTVAERSNGGSTIRASDAERSEVADLLSKHYADGRLDASELEERVEAAMKAKTRGELSALLRDLPRPQPSSPVPVAGGMRPGMPAGQPPPLLPLLLLPLFMVALVSVAAAPHIPVFLVFLPLLWLWRRRRTCRAAPARWGPGFGLDGRSSSGWPGHAPRS